MSRFLNRAYASLDVYTPGEQPKDMQYIKLNTNESPYPPSDGVIKAISEGEIEKLRLYSDPECADLRDAIAELYGVKRKNVFVSNGSDDILNFSFMAFAGREGRAVFPDITYGFYKVFSELHGVKYETKPLRDDFTIDPDDYKNTGCLTVIANPNAPTGKYLGLDIIEDILCSNKDSVLLVDEAYIDFGGESAVSLTKKYENLLVVGTFSKSRSLAGARLGFAIANEELIADLDRIKYSTNPYNVNRLTLLAGRAAILDDAYYKENCKKIIKAREYTESELKKRGFEVTDSLANFVFAKSDRISGETLYLELKKRGILVRHFTSEKIAQYNRITVGTESEMKKLIETIDIILGGMK